MKIIIDAMGGDNAPEQIVLGALQSAKEFGVQIVLVGRGEEILASMRARGWDTLPDGVEIANAEDIVDMHADPADVVKKHRGSSMVLGLKMPNLAWTSEITPIKQSGCVLIALFAGMLYTVLLCVGFFALSGWKLGFAGYTAVFAAATLAVSAGLYLWLRKRGPAVFAAL